MNNKKKYIILIFVLISVSLLGYTYYNKLRTNKQDCLQSINYYAGRKPIYFIEDSSGSRIKKLNGNTAIFKTKNDAMEYCLNFIKK